MKSKYKLNNLYILFAALYFLLFSTTISSQWVNISNISTTRLNAVKFFNENTGITAGFDGIWRTTDGGYNWLRVLNTGNFNSVSFSDSVNGTAVGDSGIIYRTVNGGLNWTQQTSGTNLEIFSVSFTHINTGYAVGKNGIILRTSNAGVSWQTQISIGYDLYNIMMRNINTGYAVGSQSNEIVVSTGNGGYNWLYMTFGTSYNLKAVTGFGVSTIIAAGTNGRIRRSTNGGVNWILPTSGTNQQLNSITFWNQNTGYVVGNLGTILKTTDSGFNWSGQNNSTVNNLRCVSFINKDTGWVVGDNGIILRTHTGGITGINSSYKETKSGFQLYQNYPNPFNPITWIYYSLEKRAYVKIAIYNVLGEEVAIVRDNLENPGIHNVIFENQSYPSGVYICKMTVGYFVQTKKMVLLK